MSKVKNRLVYAAYTRCLCGYGMAYDPQGEATIKGRGYWDCSAIILDEAGELPDGEAVRAMMLKHEAKLPFTFYEIKSERQPSANGATTREPLHRG